MEKIIDNEELSFSGHTEYLQLNIKDALQKISYNEKHD